MGAVVVDLVCEVTWTAAASTVELVTPKVKYHCPTLKKQTNSELIYILQFALFKICLIFITYFSFSQFEHGHLGHVVVNKLSVNGSTGRFQTERSQITLLRVINAENEIATDWRVDCKIFVNAPASGHVLILSLEQLKFEYKIYHRNE